MFAVFAFCPIGTTARKKISSEGNLSLRLIVFFLHQGYLVFDQLEEDGELEEARILKALELSYKEVYDLEEML